MDIGITVPDEVLTTFRDLQLSKKYHFMVLKIANKTAIEVEATQAGTEEYDYEAFCEALMASGAPRYAVADFHYENEEGHKQTKLVFFFYCPDTARAMDKMIYASTMENLKGKLEGIQRVVQATDESELDYEVAKTVMMRK
ncbi:MAG: hypothetical protein MHM6MM_000581 [Cercozoa sp. M6MM]